MAFEVELHIRQPHQRGQGAVEAIVTLPVFLLLTCLVFQLFLLGIAQVQLQYAAFYAARVGAVHNGDKSEMKLAAEKILGQFPGLGTLPRGSIRIEILPDKDQLKSKENSLLPSKEALKVQVNWQYPLTVPIADSILRTRNPFVVLQRPSIHLRSSWAIPTSVPPVGDGKNADNHGA